MKGNIIKRDGSDEAQLKIRFKGIEVYYEYDTVRDFVRDWMDQDDWMEAEIAPLERPKSEARRLIDLFLRRTAHIPTDKSGFNNWKLNDGIYDKGRTND